MVSTVCPESDSHYFLDFVLLVIVIFVIPRPGIK